MLFVIILQILQDTVAYILNNTKGLTSSRICGIVLQGNGCSKDEPSLEWTVNVDPGPKPKVNSENNRTADVRASLYTKILYLEETLQVPTVK
jgi:hypothetical protein